MINVDNLNVNVDLNFWHGEDASRIRALKLLLSGYSNNCIAEELNFSLKNIESIVSKLFRRCGITARGNNSSLINPRVKLLVHGLSHKWLEYDLEDAVCPFDYLTRNQYLSLILCASGSSNKAIAEFLCISPKTVESRLNSLFHQLAIHSQLDKQLNPRMKLVINSIIKGVVSSESITNAHIIFTSDSWDNLFQRKEEIKNELLKNQFESYYTKSHMLDGKTDLSAVVTRALNHQPNPNRENSHDYQYAPIKQHALAAAPHITYIQDNGPISKPRDIEFQRIQQIISDLEGKNL